MKDTVVEEMLCNLEPGDWIEIHTVPSAFVPEPVMVAYARKVEGGRWMVNYRLDSVTAAELAFEIAIAYLDAVPVGGPYDAE